MAPSTLKLQLPEFFFLGGMGAAMTIKVAKSAFDIGCESGISHSYSRTIEISEIHITK